MNYLEFVGYLMLSHAVICACGYHLGASRAKTGKANP